MSGLKSHTSMPSVSQPVPASAIVLELLPGLIDQLRKLEAWTTKTYVTT